MISKIQHPELFQGSFSCRKYFEGWYFKLTDAPGQTAIAVIPGVALGSSPDAPESHAFLQFIRGASAEYFRYPLSTFEAAQKEFSIRVGNNRFSRQGISLDLHNEMLRVKGDLRFSGAVLFPAAPLRPGIMGPLSYVPFLECYHGIVSLRHELFGSLKINGMPQSFDGGVGYAEKDWGRSFPRAWVWLQANRFPGNASLVLSVADMPFAGRFFRGFFAFLYIDNILHLFATYNGARLEMPAQAGGSVEAVVSGGGERLEVHAQPGAAGLLKAPKNGLMDTLIEESNDAVISVRLMGRGGKVLYEGESRCAGMERFQMNSLMRGHA